MKYYVKRHATQSQVDTHRDYLIKDMAMQIMVDIPIDRLKRLLSYEEEVIIEDGRKVVEMSVMIEDQ
jgi:hypothetical protein